MNVGGRVGVELGPLAVAVGGGLVGLLARVGVKVGAVTFVGVGVRVFVAVGVIVAVLNTGGGQGCSRIVNCWQLLPAHTLRLIKVLLGPWQSTTCLSFNVSAVLQSMLTPAVGNADAVGVMIVKVAPAGITNKACAAASRQN